MPRSVPGRWPGMRRIRPPRGWRPGRAGWWSCRTCWGPAGCAANGRSRRGGRWRHAADRPGRRLARTRWRDCLGSTRYRACRGPGDTRSGGQLRQAVRGGLWRLCEQEITTVTGSADPEVGGTISTQLDVVDIRVVTLRRQTLADRPGTHRAVAWSHRGGGDAQAEPVVPEARRARVIFVGPYIKCPEGLALKDSAVSVRALVRRSGPEADSEPLRRRAEGKERQRRDEGMVRISLSRVVRADCRRIRSPEHASCVDQLPGFPAEPFTVGQSFNWPVTPIVT